MHSAFGSDTLEIRALVSAGNGLYREYKKGPGARLRYCANEAHGVCNWLVRADSVRSIAPPASSTAPFPISPIPPTLLAWGEFERAKKRLVYSLLRLGLPLDGAAMGKSPLNFDFVNDALTGHLDGVITIAVGEADSVERERQRKAMAETYRSMLGHLRHESGHYYWMLLIDGTGHSIASVSSLATSARTTARRWIATIRKARRPTGRCATCRAYASSHAWEDWAETWAHYLHMVDALDTAAVHRLEPRAGRFGGSALGRCALRRLPHRDLRRAHQTLGAADAGAQ